MHSNLSFLIPLLFSSLICFFVRGQIIKIFIFLCFFLFILGTIDTISGMVVFRIKGENDLTERLLKRLNHRGNLHCVPASLKGKYVIRYEANDARWQRKWKNQQNKNGNFQFMNILFFLSIHFDRFTVTSTHTSNDDLLKDWAEIRKVSTELLDELNVHITDRARVHLKGIRFSFRAKRIGFSLVVAFSSCVTTQSLQRWRMDFKLKKKRHWLVLQLKSYDYMYSNESFAIRKVWCENFYFYRLNFSTWIECFFFNTQFLNSNKIQNCAPSSVVPFALLFM